MKRFVSVGITLMTLTFSLTIVTAQIPPIADAVEDHFAANADDIAVFCVNSNDSNDSVQHNENTRFPLASTFKIVILAELARQFDAGTMDLDQTVSLEDINPYWAPYADAGAHQAWLDSLPPDETVVSLRQVAEGMIGYSSNANADYLLRRLQAENFVGLYDHINLTETDLPQQTFLGLFLVYNNHETGILDLTNADQEQVYGEMQRLEEAFVASESWRTDYSSYLLEHQSEGTQIELVQSQADFFDEYGPQGSAADMMRLLRAIHTDDLFSEEAAQFLQDTLNYLLNANPANRDIYNTLAYKGGSLPGIATGAWWVQPIEIEPFELIVLHRNVPVEMWLDWQFTGANQIPELRVFAMEEGCSWFAETLVG
ncbi:serine hydrolase [bacterium]|nr:serine hydrolase [bacterium]